jgi:hypothetical protein
MADWFSAFALDRDASAAGNRVTGVTRATGARKRQNNAIYASGRRPGQLGNSGVTRVTSVDTRGAVTQVTPELPNGGLGRDVSNSAENSHIYGQATPVTQVTQETEPDVWNAGDWQIFYQERKTILEYDGELRREEVETRALTWCIITWLNANPPCGLKDEICAACGDPVGLIGDDAIPLLAGKESHAWVHHTCVDKWWLKRRGMAVAELAKMGIHAGLEIAEHDLPTQEIPEDGLSKDSGKDDGLGFTLPSGDN